MPLKHELENTGNWLFRYRSYLPFLMLPFLIYFIKYSSIQHLHNYFLLAGIIISYFGEFIRIVTIAFIPMGTSGRNYKGQFARSLNTTGMYSIVRHPLYLGNFFILLGPCIYAGNSYLIILYILIFWLYYERIMYAEESFLINKFRDEYESWSSVVPAIVPSLKYYVSPKGYFSLTKVLEREYTGICGVTFIYILLIIIRNYIFGVEKLISAPLFVILIFNTFLYISLRTIKKLKRKHLKN